MASASTSAPVGVAGQGRRRLAHALDRELNGLAAASRLLEAPEQKAELRQLAPTDLRERRLPGPHHVDARDGRALDAHRGRDARPYDDAPSAVAGGAPLECTGTQHRSSEQIERGAGQRVVGRAARQGRLLRASGRDYPPLALVGRTAQHMIRVPGDGSRVRQSLGKPAPHRVRWILEVTGQAHPSSPF
jgi:hypothetical protein